jgi:metal-responsive CopG/Arc/MetJ family transcriptional regulator
VSYERLQVASFKAEREVLDELDRLARRMNTSRSELIRRALRWYIDTRVKPLSTPKVTIYDDISKPKDTARVRFT